MKKSLIYIKSLVALAVLMLGCDETLDRSLTPADQISAIVVELQDEQSVNPNDNSGLASAYSTFVGNTVTLSSSTPDENVAERIWSIPQLLSVSSLDFEDIVDMGPVTTSFSRANNTTNLGEQTGIPIVLTETLTNGDINRYETQIQVREQVTAGIIAPSVATINVPTTIQALSAAEMGLASTDLNGEGQVVLEWDFGAGFIETPAGPVSTVVSSNVNQSFNVIFDTPTDINGEQITLTLTRNYPLQSTSVAQRSVIVVSGLTPNRGPGKDAIKLSADGNRIVVGYEEPIGDISVISAADFEISIETDEITDAPSRNIFDNISVSSIAIDAGNPNNLVLTLSSAVPSILMDNVSLSFISTLLTSQSGEEISLFLNSTVFQTGENLLGTAAYFEDQSTWSSGGFFFPNPVDTPELEFSTEVSFDGTTSMLFNSMGALLSGFPNNFGIGANVVHNGFGTLPTTSIPGEYVQSFWVYVESAAPNTFVTFFLLDFAEFNTGAQADVLPTGEWVKISGTRNIAAGGDLRALVRVVNGAITGNGKIFIDQVELRAVDDGR
ncbi:hypothetical protein [Flavivirga algicola]|uniref:DUF5689 domain-containing protein n=1 Tax=Flavivirga algicola TaxID=2729136 RepID=A0ABX1RSQ8_9FLAO|nr:hypothetical protein [Flavivirga algicola]NMH86015.1 hypothetical protein [Flavivirga algicola]